jgi:uncharacterized protein YjiS (DUF1127 family)
MKRQEWRNKMYVASLTNYQSTRLGLLARAALLAKRVARTLRVWGSRIRQRHVFPEIDDRELRDLRISRWELQRELAKPFWRG